MRIKKTIFFAFFKELSNRFSYIILSFIFTFFTCFLHSVEIFYFTLSPVLSENKKFFFLDLTEGFTATIQLCFIITFYFSLPFFFYQLWCFLLPGRYYRERGRGLYFLSFLSLAFLFLTLHFYFFFLPDLCQFLIQFEINTQSLTVHFETRIQTYLFLIFQVISFLFLLWAVLPIVFLGIKYNIISSNQLLSYRLSFLLFSLLFTAFTSPPTPSSQLGFLSLLLCVYEGLILYSISKGFFYKTKGVT